MMIAKKTTSLPELWANCLTQYSADELVRGQSMKVDLFLKSKRVWLLSKDGEPIGVCGVVHHSWIGSGAELWFMPCVGFTRNVKTTLRFIRRAIPRLHYASIRLVIHVVKDFSPGDRFARALNFTFTGEHEGLDGKTYNAYCLGASCPP